MPPRYEQRFFVRSYEIGAAAEVRPDIYPNYLEEGGVNASASLGYDYDWYARQQRVWVARKLYIRWHGVARLGDELALTTWISSARRVQAFREYELRRATDQTLLLRARHLWVFLDAQTLLPVRIPPEFAERYAPTHSTAPDALEALDIDRAGLLPLDNHGAPLCETDQRVAWHELDQNRHVNNAVYVRWAEQSICTALRHHGWPPEALTADHMSRLARETDYLRSLQDNEPLTISTRIETAGVDRLLWLTTIRTPDQATPVAEDRLLCRVSSAVRQALIG